MCNFVLYWVIATSTLVFYGVFTPNNDSISESNQTDTLASFATEFNNQTESINITMMNETEIDIINERF